VDFCVGLKSFEITINASTINSMGDMLVWDETKRQSNLRKHGLDFADAPEVLDSRYRLDIAAVRGGELRMQSISYALGFLAVLTVVHTERDGATRVISFRHASNEECEVYGAVLGSKTNELSRAQVLAAVRALPQGSGYVWDGVDEDDRPLNDEELQTGLVAAIKKRGRPAGSGTKERVAIRFDR
jgi:uncharacterized DUF497 family protein